MLPTHADLYLPISTRVLDRVLHDAESFEDEVSKLDVAPVAALILLQYLPKLKQTRSPPPDRVLAEAIKSGNAQVRRGGSSSFAADAIPILDRAKIREGSHLLPDFGMALLDDEVILQQSYLTADGEWDSTFRDRHRAQLTQALQTIVLPAGGHGVLTLEQSRIFREVKTQADDHIHVQGYAGTGKSYLIKSLLTMLQPTGAKVLVLAERQRQLDALLVGTEQMGHVHPRRYGKLVSEMVPSDLTDPVNRRMARTNYSLTTIPDDEVVRHLGIQSGSGFLSREIVKAVRSTVAGFCYSGDRAIDAQHIPDWCASSFDATTKQIVLHHATELWKAILSPSSRDFQPPVRDYHRVKWAALKGWQVPIQYTHVLIDECHDLAKPMLQILDCSPQAVISLGDEYQNLQGRPQQRSNVIRQRAVTHSVRAGHTIESIVNPIITTHPGKVKLPFHGNPLSKTEITYYDKAQVPDKPAAILVSDTWGLFEWAQRLAARNVDLTLLSSRNNLDIFVKDCIELHRHGSRPRHGELFRFGSWEALANRYHDNGGFQRIDRMLRSGYSTEDWMKTSNRFVKQGLHGYALGLIEDARNREFDAVMLAPELIDQVWNAERAALAAAGSAVYVAVTRARRQLIVPERLRNWIEEISQSVSSRRAGMTLAPDLTTRRVDNDDRPGRSNYHPAFDEQAPPA